MTDKRFVEFATQSTDNGEINNGFYDIKTGEWYYTKDSENAKKICELLNELHEENERFKFILQEAIRTERTDIGKNVLKQLADNLGVKYE